MSRLGRLVRRARKLSAQEVASRLAQKTWALTERLSMWREPGAAAAQLGEGDRRALGPFFPGAVAASETARQCTRRDPAHVADILSRAERMLTGRLPVFGLGWIDVGEPPRWHREPLAGVTAPRRHWSTIPYLDVSAVGDHKILWEFNRHQHFVTLGQAWVLTGDDRFATLFASHVDSWIRENPVRVGVNWSSSLEVAYRAISWCWSLHLFSGSPALTPERRSGMYGVLRAHAVHLTRYLSTYFSPNTHLTGEALGLYYLGTVLPGFREAPSWRSFGADILNRQLPIQVHADGVYFEQATQYHRYTAEIYLHYWILAAASGATPEVEMRSRMTRLFDVLAALRRADGTMPLMGDDDGGRLIQLDGETPERIDGLLATAARVFERPDWIMRADAPQAMSVWMLGEERVASGDAEVVPLSLHSQGSAAFTDGGVYVLRSAEQRGHAVISCGPHGSLSCGHAHADALALVLHDGDGDIFVDAGTFTYMGPERNDFRGERGHNSLTLASSTDFLPAGPFSWTKKVDGHAISWAVANDASYFRGACGDGGVGVTRYRSAATPAPGLWIVEDSCDSTLPIQAELRWRLASDLTATVTEQWDGGGRIDLSRRGRLVSTVVIISEGGALDLVPAWVSPQYGRRLPTELIRWRGELDCNRKVRSVVIVWDHTTGVPVRIGAGHTARTIALPGQSASAATVDIGFLNFPFSSSDVHADTDYAVTIPGSGPEPEAVRLVAFGVRHLQFGTGAAVKGAVPMASATFDQGRWEFEDVNSAVGR